MLKMLNSGCIYNIHKESFRHRKNKRFWSAEDIVLKMELGEEIEAM